MIDISQELHDLYLRLKWEDNAMDDATFKRLQDEEATLETKYAALAQFLEQHNRDIDSYRDGPLMEAQLAIMEAYMKILNSRIYIQAKLRGRRDYEQRRRNDDERTSD